MTSDFNPNPKIKRPYLIRSDLKVFQKSQSVVQLDAAITGWLEKYYDLTSFISHLVTGSNVFAASLTQVR